MGETQIKKIEELYLLSNGKCSIFARILLEPKKITLTPISDSHREEVHKFCFLNSDPEMVYTLGTLIRDAADLVNER